MQIFRKGAGPYAFAEAMTGVRLGEKLLYVGAGDPALFAALAAKVGLTGRARAIVESERDRQRVEQAAARGGVLVEVAVVEGHGLPAEDNAFDVAVLDATSGFLLRAPAGRRTELAAAALAALRPRGRGIVVERTPKGLLAAFRGDPEGLAEFAADGGAIKLLRDSGFDPVRMLADSHGERYSEGWKRPADSGVALSPGGGASADKPA